MSLDSSNASPNSRSSTFERSSSLSLSFASNQSRLPLNYIKDKPTATPRISSSKEKSNISGRLPTSLSSSNKTKAIVTKTDSVKQQTQPLSPDKGVGLKQSTSQTPSVSLSSNKGVIIKQTNSNSNKLTSTPLKQKTQRLSNNRIITIKSKYNSLIVKNRGLQSNSFTSRLNNYNRGTLGGGSEVIYDAIQLPRKCINQSNTSFKNGIRIGKSFICCVE